MEFLQKIFGSKGKLKYEGNNAELVHAMNDVALQDNDQNRQKLYSAFLKSILLVPTPELPDNFSKPGKNVLERPTKISMIVISDRDGKKVTPAFTDIDALRAWDPNVPSFGVNADAFFQMVLGTEIEGIIINPFDPIRKMVRPGGLLYRRELELLAKKLIPSHIEPQGVEFRLKTGDEVMIGAPAVPPHQSVIEALRAAAAERPAIAELYIFQMAVTDSSQTVVGIKPDQKMNGRGNDDQLARALGNAIQTSLGEGQILDFMVLSGQLEQQIKARFTPIYRREASEQ